MKKFKHVHKCERCGTMIGMDGQFHAYSFKSWILWNIGWGAKHWKLAWVCPNCGNLNDTYELSTK